MDLKKYQKTWTKRKRKDSTRRHHMAGDRVFFTWSSIPVGPWEPNLSELLTWWMQKFKTRRINNTLYCLQAFSQIFYNVRHMVEQLLNAYKWEHQYPYCRYINCKPIESWDSCKTSSAADLSLSLAAAELAFGQLGCPVFTAVAVWQIGHL